MRTNWKAKYNELLAAAELHLKAITRLQSELNAALRDEMSFLARLPKFYDDEDAVVCRHRRTNMIYIAGTDGITLSFPSLDAAIDWYGQLSNLPHNLRSIEILTGLRDRAIKAA